MKNHCGSRIKNTIGEKTMGHHGHLADCQLSMPVKDLVCYLSNVSCLAIELHKMTLGENQLSSHLQSCRYVCR